MKKSLVVYYSQSGNTKGIAQLIHTAIGADLLEIEALHPYPKKEEDFYQQVHNEIENHIDPKYKAVNVDLCVYDLIFVGTPNWGGTIALPLATFLKEHDVSNKIILPFVSHKGTGVDEIQNDIQRLCIDADVKDVFTVYKNIEEYQVEDILEWIHTYY